MWKPSAARPGPRSSSGRSAPPMDGSSLLLFGHSPSNERDKGVFQGGFALLHTPDLPAGSLDDPHDTGQRRVAGQLKTEPVDAVLLGDARGGHAVYGAQRIQESGARAELEVDDRILLDPLLQLGRRPLSDDASAIHDRHPVAEFVGLHHVMRRKDDGPAWILRHPAAHLVAHVAGGADVQCHRRLVKEQDARMSDEASDQVYLLTDPPGEAR